MEQALEIVCPAWYPGAESLIDAIPLLADQGVTAVEIGVNFSSYFNFRDARELQALISVLSSSGVRIHSVHSPFGPGYDISSPDDNVHDRGVDALIDSIELANVTDATKVIVHASDILPGCRHRQFDRARGVLREMAAVARESGVTLALENLPPTYLGNCPEEIFALLDGIDRESIAVCFDSGHANLSGHFEEYAQALLPYAVTTHIHDNNGTDDQHRFPGEGIINWPRFASIYRSTGCDAGMMLECTPPQGIAWCEAFQMFRTALGE
ncbi:MAG: sugar phosphate isomerase/epimerase family protein [Armatimonadota bacterium]|nr:sugar phosphate isomerase/epimerase [bacterium]